MVKTCILCKKESTFLNRGRSFHKFPKDKKLKQEWMHATGLSVVTRTAVICSDHFDPNAFHDTGGCTKIKRLLSNAVPQKKKDCHPQVRDNYSQSISTDVSNCNTTITNTNTTSVGLTNETIEHTGYPSTRLTITESNSTRCADNMVDGSSNTRSDNIFAAESCGISSDNETAVTVSDSVKRKHSDFDVRPLKKLRFTTGFKTEYISRKDFLSDEAWERFKRFNNYKNLKLRAANSRNIRKEQKISNVKALVNNLKEKQFSDAADYLKVN